MAIADDVARLTREVWRLNQVHGWLPRLGYTADLGQVAKAAGATQGMVQSWMRGDVQPTTSQALAVLDALPLPADRAAVTAAAT